MDISSAPHLGRRADDSPVADAQPRLSTWLRVLLPTILFLPAASAGILLVLMPGYEEMLGRDDEMAILAYAPYATVVLAAYVLVSWALVRWVDRRPFPALGLRVDARAVLALVTGCAIALAIALVSALVADAFGMGRQVDAEAMGQPTIAPAAVLALVLLRAFVLQGIGEEVLFRGYLMQSLRNRPVLGVVVAALAFTVPHLASSGGQQSVVEHLLYLAIPFGFAISAGFLAIAMRSVWAAVGIHGGFHLATWVVSLLGAGSDGPAVWLTLGGLHVLVGAVIAVRTPGRRWVEVREHGPYSPRSKRHPTASRVRPGS
ncbi:CPBP family intramembrane glutamic endopeptidase [Brachybacterium paraconglomeratum]|uniref:CPBP family intramembrane glutamic endopeptidase n=1 Tax=Brachybacterium paraconglomeratum TaxID=173362 RepID=UPI00223B372B|nr:type II CAAX endopeptidase family protein [Brachybacterium paraconglomeratum]MCT1437985.1 CPBP family intramembrane metalloprotease [Brachybacterium paraconglomeratum]